MTKCEQIMTRIDKRNQEAYKEICERLLDALRARAWPPMGIVLRADVFDFLSVMMTRWVTPSMGVPEAFYGIPVHKGDGMSEEFIFLTT